MQYTIRNIPPNLDRKLRALAKEQETSINQVALEALLAGVGLEGEVERRDLSDVTGTWIDDPVVDRALTEQRRIDEDLWT